MAVRGNSRSLAGVYDWRPDGRGWGGTGAGERCPPRRSADDTERDDDATAPPWPARRRSPMCPAARRGGAFGRGHRVGRGEGAGGHAGRPGARRGRPVGEDDTGGAVDGAVGRRPCTGCDRPHGRDHRRASCRPTTGRARGAGRRGHDRGPRRAGGQDGSGRAHRVAATAGCPRRGHRGPGALPLPGGWAVRRRARGRGRGAGRLGHAGGRRPGRASYKRSTWRWRRGRALRRRTLRCA